MKVLIATLLLALSFAASPCARPTAANWHDVLAQGRPLATWFSPATYPFRVVYVYDDRYYLFVSNDDNQHGRCLVEVP